MARSKPIKVRGLVFEHGSYVVRMVVPADVRAAFGKREFRRNLKTDNKAMAAIEAESARAEWKSWIARARNGETPEHVRAVVDGWKQAQDRSPAATPDLLRLLSIAIAGSQHEEAVNVASRLGLNSQAGRLAVGKALMEIEQARVFKASARETVRVADSASVRASNYEREKFEAISTPIKPLVLCGYSLDEMYKIYSVNRSESDARNPLEANYVAALKDFMGGDFDLSLMTPMKALEFSQCLPDYPARRVGEMRASSFMRLVKANREAKGTDRHKPGVVLNTQANWMKFFNRLFTLAVEKEVLPKNPFATVRVKVPRGGMTGTHLSEADVKTYFSQSAFQGIRDHHFWLAVAGLFTGCRLDELVSAASTDFVEIEGRWFLDLRHRVTKTECSSRLVPIHPRLAGMGFAEWVRCQQGAPFPLAMSSYSKRSSKAMAGLGIRNTFHGLRHTFSRMARDSGLSKDMKDLIMGHATDISDRYGPGVSPEKLWREMEKVQFKSFPL